MEGAAGRRRWQGACEIVIGEADFERPSEITVMSG